MNEQLTPPQGVAFELFRPRRKLWRHAWLACMMFTVPIFLALYVIVIPTGRWFPFVVAHVVLLLLFTIAAYRLWGAGVTLAADGIREREYFSRMVFTPVEAVASVAVISVRNSYSDDIVEQVFFLDAEGCTVLRFRSQMWDRADLNRMINFYAVPIYRSETPLSWSQLRRSHGRNLDIWERHPIVTRGALTLLLLIVFVPLLIGTLAAIQ